MTLLFQLQRNDAKTFLDSLLEAPQTFVVIIPAATLNSTRSESLISVLGPDLECYLSNISSSWESLSYRPRPPH